MKRRRRETEVFSLSFLDVICCGFGAIILLLVLSEFGQPLVIERSTSSDRHSRVNSSSTGSHLSRPPDSVWSKTKS